MIRGMCRDCDGCMLCQEQNDYDYDARDDYEADRGEEEREERLLNGIYNTCTWGKRIR